MELSYFIAKVLGIIYLLSAVGALSGKIDFGKMIKEMSTSSALAFISGVFTLIVGALIIEHHNVWEGGWPVVITIVGWLTAIKGGMLIVYPQFANVGKGLLNNAKPLGAIMLVLAAIFLYLGFMA